MNGEIVTVNPYPPILPRKERNSNKSWLSCKEALSASYTCGASCCIRYFFSWLWICKFTLPTPLAYNNTCLCPRTQCSVLQALVERTRAHPRYSRDYTFSTDSTWITGAPCGPACTNLPQVVAIDCEMCESEVRFRDRTRRTTVGCVTGGFLNA